MTDEEALKVFEEYFSIFPWDYLPKNAEGFDMGCGTGRWARWVAPRIGHLHCIDPSTAINIAQKKLYRCKNVTFHTASVDSTNLRQNSQDFGYSLGVLHHLPNTTTAIQSCVKLLKPGAPLLLYLYYAFDNRPWWFVKLWQISNFVRKIISRLPSGLKHFVTDIIASLIYWPLAKLSNFIEFIGLSVANLPLSFYRHHNFYTMRTDARDRFGTPLEKRFTRTQIIKMMKLAGLINVRFSDHAPFWCVVGYKEDDAI